MPIITQARERVCQSLLNRITAFDHMIEEAEEVDNPGKMKACFIRQTSLLNRLEKLVVN